MTKKEIVRQIADRIHETQLKTKEIVQLTFDAIIDTLLIGSRRIELRNFGVFEVKLRKKRKARNPRTNENVEVKPKFVVTFKPGKEMEERVRSLVPTPQELAALEKPKKKKAAEMAPVGAQAAPMPAPVPPPSGDGTDSAEPVDGSAPRPRKKSSARKTTQV